jgi:Fe-S cluster assembly iron-binding protein IscA
MLTVTPQARDLIAKALDVSEAGKGEALRIYLTEDGEFEMGVDEAHEDDQVIEEAGRPLVLIDPEISWELDGATLDAEEGPEGLDLMLDLPEEEGEE